MTIYKHSYNFKTKEVKTEQYQASLDGRVLKIFYSENEYDCEYFLWKPDKIFCSFEKSYAAMDRGESGEVYMFSKSPNCKEFVEDVLEFCRNSINFSKRDLDKMQRKYDKTKTNMNGHIQILNNMTIEKEQQESYEEDR